MASPTEGREQNLHVLPVVEAFHPASTRAYCRQVNTFARAIFSGNDGYGLLGATMDPETFSKLEGADHPWQPLRKPREAVSDQKTRWEFDKWTQQRDAIVLLRGVLERTINPMYLVGLPGYDPDDADGVGLAPYPIPVVMKFLREKYGASTALTHRQALAVLMTPCPHGRVDAIVTEHQRAFAVLKQCGQPPSDEMRVEWLLAALANNPAMNVARSAWRKYNRKWPDVSKHRFEGEGGFAPFLLHAWRAEQAADAAFSDEPATPITASEALAATTRRPALAGANAGSALAAQVFESSDDVLAARLRGMGFVQGPVRGGEALAATSRRPAHAGAGRKFAPAAPSDVETDVAIATRLRDMGFVQDRLCHACGKPGHLARACPVATRKVCKVHGTCSHTWRECRSNPANKPGGGDRAGRKSD